VNLYVNVALARRIVLLVVLVGLLVSAIGAYNLISAKNRYNELDAIPLPPTEELRSLKPGDPLLTRLALLARDKRELQAQQGSATSIIGLGVMVIGVAVVIFMRLPEQDSRHA
jgi:hypothetical protein